MEVLRNYLNSLTVADQADFCARCGTTIGYLRKAICIGQHLREKLCINIDRESSGCVPVESLRPDVDWAYLRAARVPANQIPPSVPQGAVAE